MRNVFTFRHLATTLLPTRPTNGQSGTWVPVRLLRTPCVRIEAMVTGFSTRLAARSKGEGLSGTLRTEVVAKAGHRFFRARVARMLHGVADSYCQPLKLLRNILQHMRYENGGYRCRHFQIYVVISRWWGRQDSNLRRHSQRIYSPPPLPLGTLPQSHRTVLISKDKSGSPAGRSGCVGLMRELPPPSQWMVSMERPRGKRKMKKAAGGSGGFL